MDFDTFNDLVILRHNKSFKVTTEDELTARQIQQVVLAMRAAGTISAADETLLANLDQQLFQAAGEAADA